MGPFLSLLSVKYIFPWSLEQSGGLEIISESELDVGAYRALIGMKSR